MSAFHGFGRVLIAAVLASALAAAGLVAYYGTGANAQGDAPGAAKGPVAGGSDGARKAGKAPGGRAGQQQGPVPVTVTSVTQQAVPYRIQAVGSAEAYATVAVKARVDGQIVEVRFREGQEVRAGNVLFNIDPRPFEAALRQAEANHQRDLAQLAQAERQEARYQELLAKNFVSKEAYAQFRTGTETAAAAVLASKAAIDNARLQLEYTTIRSPIDGYAGRIQIQKGNLVKANDATPLVVLNQVHPIYVSFAVPEQELPSVRKYLAAGPLAVEARPPNAERAASGRLVFIDNTVDSTTGTIKLKALFENRENTLWPGQFVSASLRLYEQKDALTVPSRAVQTGPSGQYVFVVKPDMSVEVRPVSVQRSEGDLAIIATGLARAEQVVTQGQLRLAPGTKVIVKGDGRQS
ncbi:MAG: efflux RND transporter periplasmic adaptor subunit [Burkholderiales bacterium]|nr:efflux RND transporter periplasmic adaptor subunit [Burkholderiales bacterium]